MLQQNIFYPTFKAQRCAIYTSWDFHGYIWCPSELLCQLNMSYCAHILYILKFFISVIKIKRGFMKENTFHCPEYQSVIMESYFQLTGGLSIEKFSQIEKNMVILSRKGKSGGSFFCHSLIFWLRSCPLLWGKIQRPLRRIETQVISIILAAIITNCFWQNNLIRFWQNNLKINLHHYSLSIKSEHMRFNMEKRLYSPSLPSTGWIGLQEA